MVGLDGILALDDIVNLRGGGRGRGQIQIGHACAEVAVPPADLLAVGTDIRPAAFELQIHDAVALGLDGQDGVGKTHAAVHRGDEPFPVGRPVECVEVFEFLVRMLPRLPGPDVVNEQALGREIRIAEALELSLHVGNLRAVRAPARLAGIVGDLGAAGAVHMHHVHVADLVLTLAFVRNETDFAAVRRWLGIELVHVRGARQVDRLGAVRIRDIQLPVAVTIGLVDRPRQRN